MRRMGPGRRRSLGVLLELLVGVRVDQAGEDEPDHSIDRFLLISLERNEEEEQ